ncbi:MAG: type II secretion system protein [Actinobacteria bacterium]|nr:MAG: type II secretion system protein [Actinomycetota bacterium]
MLTRLRGEKGFGLLELLMAMTMLSIGILALVAAFNSGQVALQRASRTSTAAALADAQMERYRALTYAAIVLDASSVTNADSTYKNDSVLGGNIANDVTTSTDCGALPPECVPSRNVTGADRHNYRLDSYVTLTTPPNGRQLKLVTVVVRGTISPYPTYAREQSTFDLSTGS